MTKIAESEGYDFYIDTSGNTYYNIVPRGSEVPKGGYRNRDYIEHIKGVRFPQGNLEEAITNAKERGVIL